LIFANFGRKISHVVERDVRLETADLVVLGNRWQNACSKFGLKDRAGAGQSTVFEKVARTYLQRPGYHNLDHLSFMFRLLDQYRGNLRNPAVLDLAVFFHELCYFPRSARNEEDSARLSKVHLYSMGARDALMESISDLILATKEHKVVNGARDDLAYFLDSDMAILGADKESYRKYAVGVALDFKVVGIAHYADNRQRFLKGLQNKRIFSTDEMHARFHDAAQKNIKEEVEQWKKIGALFP